MWNLETKTEKEIIELYNKAKPTMKKVVSLKEWIERCNKSDRIEVFAKNYFDKYYPYLAPFILSTIPNHHDLTSSVDKDFQIEVKHYTNINNNKKDELIDKNVRSLFIVDDFKTGCYDIPLYYFTYPVSDEERDQGRVTMDRVRRWYLYARGSILEKLLYTEKGVK